MNYAVHDEMKKSELSQFLLLQCHYKTMQYCICQCTLVLVVLELVEHNRGFLSALTE